MENQIEVTMSSNKNIFLTFIGKLVESFKTKWQQIIFGIILFVSIITFVFSLIYATNWAGVNNIFNQDDLKILLSANQNIFYISLLSIALVVVNMMFGSHTRKRYYLINYILVTLTVIVAILGIVIFIQTTTSMEKLFQSAFDASTGYSENEWRAVYITRSGNMGGGLTTEEEIAVYAVKFKSGVFSMINYGYLIALLFIANIASGIMVIINKILITPQLREQDKYRKEVIRLADLAVKEKTRVSEKGTAPVKSESVEIKKIDQSLLGVEFNKVDKLRYQPNKLGYSLTLLGLIIFIVALFSVITYTSKDSEGKTLRVIPDFYMAIDITLAIALMLISFLAGEKIKSYSKSWSIGLFVLATVNVMRMFWIPLSIYNKNQMHFNDFMFSTILLLISVGLYIAAGIISFIKTSKLNKHLKDIGEV